jgi:hypothetical protein
VTNDYVTRATGTRVGIGANSRDEALYRILDKDVEGQPLDGSKDKYMLRFARGQLPQVNAFWSIMMYDLPRQLLVKNPINRYLVNAPILPGLKIDADGGMTIYIQNESPARTRSRTGRRRRRGRSWPRCVTTGRSRRCSTTSGSRRRSSG